MTRGMVNALIEIRAMKNQHIEAVDLFCGIGGLSYGLKQADIKVIAGLDNDKTCSVAYEKNNDARFIAADISKYDFSEMRGMFSDKSVKVLVGCAPCQPFSSHSFKAKNREHDARWNLLSYFVKAIDELKPEVISMENVPGLTKTEVFAQFRQDIIDRGYFVDYKVVYCPDYGIPQSRNRLVFVASRLGPIKVPTATHQPKDYVKVKDTIKGLPRLNAGGKDKNDPIHRCMKLEPINLRRIKASKQGGSWQDWDKELLPNCYKRATGKGYTPVYGRMKWTDTAPTMTTQFYNYGSGRFGHPSQNRAVSLREGALIQTFPKSYEFDDTLPTSKIARHIGNAVPPRLGEILGRTMKEHIDKYDPSKV